MQRSRPVLVLGCRVGASLDEESGQIYMTPRGRQLKWGRPVLALGSRIGAVLDEDLGQIHITP
jgi:hypothetical protein